MWDTVIVILIVAAAGLWALLRVWRRATGRGGQSGCGGCSGCGQAGGKKISGADGPGAGSRTCGGCASDPGGGGSGKTRAPVGQDQPTEK